MKKNAMKATNLEIAAIDLQGGHPALDFINTVHNWHADPPPDYLHGFDDFIDWGLVTGVMWPNSAKHFKAAPEKEKKKAFKELLRLRDCLHTVFSQLAAGEPISQDALDFLNDIVRRTAQWRRLSGDEETGCTTICCTWDFTAAPPIAAVGSIAWDAANLLEHGELDRIKECPSDSCGWLFLDMSRNRSRQWCSMKVCGNNAKVKRFREKQG